MSESNRKPDMRRYAKLDKPFESSKDADAAIQSFFAGLAELREAAGFADVLVVLRVRYKTEDGDESQALLPLSYGSDLHMEPMAAMALGWAQRNRQEMVGRLLAQAGALMRPKGE